MAIQVGSLEISASQSVALPFVKQYYSVLEKCPENLHKFYKDGSTVSWLGLDGQLASESTIEEINNVIMSSYYIGSATKYTTLAQDMGEGIIVSVKGLLQKDKRRMSFSQVFYLAPQERGYFVLNDLLLVDGLAVVPAQSKPAEMCTGVPTESKSQTMVNGVPAESKSQTMVNVEIITTTPEDTKPHNSGMVSGDTGLGAEVTKQSMDNTQTVSNTIESTTGVSDTTVEGPIEANMSSQNVNLEAPKISYASMVAKESKIAFPTENYGSRIVRVAPTANQSSVIVPSKSKTAPQEETSSIVSSTEYRNCNDKNGNEREAFISETIHIQNLPSDISEKELIDAFKVFGQIRQGGVQFRVYKDGFCYGFVRFESRTSAKAAVEANNITLRGWDTRISYKRPINRAAGNGTRGNGRYLTGNFKGQKNGDNNNNNKKKNKGQENGEYAENGKVNSDQAHGSNEDKWQVVKGRENGESAENGKVDSDQAHGSNEDKWEVVVRRNVRSRGGRARSQESYGRGRKTDGARSQESNGRGGKSEGARSQESNGRGEKSEDANQTRMKNSQKEQKGG